MQSVYVQLSGAETVQKFVEQISALDGDFDLVAGNYILDARSLMGIFSLDISKPIELRIYNDTPENMQHLARFIVTTDTKHLNGGGLHE